MIIGSGKAVYGCGNSKVIVDLSKVAFCHSLCGSLSPRKSCKVRKKNAKLDRLVACRYLFSLECLASCDVLETGWS